jgi:hypothetical protein
MSKACSFMSTADSLMSKAGSFMSAAKSFRIRLDMNAALLALEAFHFF